VTAPNLSDLELTTPIKIFDQISYLVKKYHDLYFVAVLEKLTANVTIVFQFLERFISIMEAYFGANFTPDTIKENYVLIYELLDETLDFGYPQITDADALKAYITTADDELYRNMSKQERAAAIQNTLLQATGQPVWRNDKIINHKKNEIFIDVIESVNLLVSGTGQVLRSEVQGQIKIKSQLNGMPECKLGLNDRLGMQDSQAKARSRPGTTAVDIEDFKFHQCVKLGQFERDRTINFTPPDGVFTLVQYRSTENINLPFKVSSVVSETTSRIDITVTVNSQYAKKLNSSQFVLKIPVPSHTASTTISKVVGTAAYESGEGAIVWKIKKVPGMVEYRLAAVVHLTATKDRKVWVREPITINFQVPMFPASGLHVRFLKIIEKQSIDYQAIKWVRYITQSGTYAHRLPPATSERT